jgi:8-amino-7-oxononanoate synthase
MRHTYLPYTQFCAKLRKNHLLRHLPRAKTYLYDFSSNDYLGLSQHPLLIQAAIDAADKYGVGSKSSRLIATSQSQIQALESLIARSKHSQSALIFISGYQANISVLTALMDPMVHGAPPLVFSDRLNHASMHAACKSLNIKQHRFHHLDYDHLKYLLQKTKSLSQPRFILSESVFGMDGDIADLEILIRLAKDFSAILYIDEAHATGLFGKRGFGLTEDYKDDIDISMGTFSKALGGSGAYITCSSIIKRFLVNKCQGFVFSTAPSPMQVAAMHQAWDLIPILQPQAKMLLEKATNVREKLRLLNIDTASSTTHIIPIILKEPAKTLAAQRFLATKGIRVSAIRSPSVPPNQSRLRIALNVNHHDEAIHYLLSALEEFYCLS